MKWEYLVIKLFSLSHIKVDEIQEDAVRANIDTLELYGSEGWELVSVDNGIAYFKRPDFSDIVDKAMKMITLSSSEIPQNFEGIQSQVKTGYIDAR